MPGKKKGKKKGTKKSSKSGESGQEVRRDPVAPEYVPPPARPGEQLIKLLTTHHVDEKELHGIKVSSRALKELTPQEIKDLHIVFDAFDLHGRRMLGPVDLRKALRALGFKVTRVQARQAIHDTSVKGSSAVEFNEFLDIVIDKQGDSRDVYDEIMQGFHMFDYENTGMISVDNLRQACRDAGVKFSKQEMQDMMQEADHNGDGYVDKEEFIKIMLQTNLF